MAIAAWGEYAARSEALIPRPPSATPPISPTQQARATTIAKGLLRGALAGSLLLDE
jgi:hypothetical protein